VSREKYSVVDVFKQYAETYIFISNSSNVGSHPHISTILSRIGPKSTKPNLLKKEPIRILTNSGTFKDRDTFNISSTDIPKAKNRANIEPADDPEISLTSTRLDSIAFRVPIIEYIPIDAGPNTRYFILLLNRIEEIACVKAQRPRQRQRRGSQPLECWSDPTGRDHRSLGG